MATAPGGWEAPHQEKGVRDMQGDRGTARTMVQADPAAAACLQLRRYSQPSACSHGLVLVWDG